MARGEHENLQCKSNNDACAMQKQAACECDVVAMKARCKNHSYDILGAGMLWKPKDLHKIH